MKDKFKSKKTSLIIIISLLIMVIGVGTYSYIKFYFGNTLIGFTVNGLTDVVIYYEGGPDISSNNIVPVGTKELGISKEIQVKAKKLGDNPILMSLNLEVNSISSGYNHESFIWELYKDDTLVGTGNFLNAQNGTNIQLFNSSYDNTATVDGITKYYRTVTTTLDTYTLYIWVDGKNFNNPPEMVENQSFSFSVYGDGIGTNVVEPVPPNPPTIDSTYMVPVYYDSTSSTWKIANKNNDTEANAWYNYTGKQWANMVLVGASASSCTPGTDCLDSVTKHDRDYYTDQSNVGQPVSMDDILAFYVWIPRYKYKVWNINKIPQEDQAYTYNAYNDGIDIQWESGTNSTGNVSCAYYYTAPVADAGSPNEACTVTGDTSNPYYTHPAFTFGDDELTGIWVGKFETSSNTHLTGTSYGGGNVTSLTARIVPNVTSWRNIEIGNMFTVIQNMHNASNEYGLPTTKTSVDSHMMKNTEWGAVVYLTNSIYGKCTGLPGGCTEVQINGKGETSYYTAITGCGPSADGATARYETACTEYNTTTGMLASTTGNITGVYDMAGGAWEYVMGNESSATGAYTFYPSSTSSTMAVSWYTATTSKYVDTYAYDSGNYQGQIAYNRSRLSDATGEVNITGSYSGGWYSDYAHFVCSSDSWFLRGGVFDDGTGAGPFGFVIGYGGAIVVSSFRASLVSLGDA